MNSKMTPVTTRFWHAFVASVGSPRHINSALFQNSWYIKQLIIKLDWKGSHSPGVPITAVPACRLLVVYVGIRCGLGALREGKEAHERRKGGGAIWIRIGEDRVFLRVKDE